MKELMNKIISKASKYGDAEANLNISESLSVNYENEKIKYISSSNGGMLYIRVTLKDGRFGLSVSTPDKWKECIEESYKLAKISNPDKEYQSIPECKKAPKISVPFSGINEKEISDFGEDMISSALNYDKRIKISGAGANYVAVKTYFMNSNGVYDILKSNLLSGGVDVKCGDINASESHSSEEKFDSSWIGKKASEICISSLNPKKMKTQKASVIMDYDAASSFISACVCPALSGFNVQKKRSVYAEKKGERVMDEKITITDDGLLKAGLMTSKRDAEGTPKQRTVLIENGILKEFMYDHYTAKKENRESTGNSSGITSRPLISPTNFIIAKGDMDFDEIIKETGNGIYVREVMGEHTINTVSGDFSLQVVNPFAVKNGELDYPVKETMISGNVFELMKNVRFIGNKYRQESEIVCPVICFENVQIIS